MCYQILKDEHLLRPSLTYSSKVKFSTLISEDPCIQAECLRLIPNIPMDFEIAHPDWVKIQSSLLREGKFVVTVFDIKRPVLGQIIDLVRLESTVVIYIQLYIGQMFVSHYSVFLIHSTGKFYALDVCSLQDYRPITVKSSFDTCEHGLYAFLPYYY